MRPARGVNSYKYSKSYDKDVSSEPNIQQLNPENTYQLLRHLSTILIYMYFQLKFEAHF